MLVIKSYQTAFGNLRTSLLNAMGCMVSEVARSSANKFQQTKLHHCSYISLLKLQQILLVYHTLALLYQIFILDFLQSYFVH